MEGLRADATAGTKRQRNIPQGTQESIEGCPESILQLIAQKLSDPDLVAVSFCTTSLRKVANDEMSSRVQEVLAHKSCEKIVNNIKVSLNHYIQVADKWDVDTVKKCLEGAIETTIGMKAFEGVSRNLPRTISGRYLMMRNVMLCGQNQGGEKIGKTEEECLKVHILKGSSIEYMTKRFGERVSANPQVWFRYAAGNGHLEMVKYLVEKFELTAGDVRSRDNHALRCAAANGHIEMVQYLVEKFELTAEDARANDNVVLRWAASNGHLEMVQYLVEQFKLTAEDARANDNVVLREVAENGHIEMVQYLVETFELTAEDARACVNYALRLSAAKGQLEMVKYLVEQFKLTADDARADDNFVLRWAAEKGHLEMVQYLVDQFELTAADVTARDHEIQRTAIKKQNQPLLHFLRTRFNMTEEDLYFASAAYE